MELAEKHFVAVERRFAREYEQSGLLVLCDGIESGGHETHAYGKFVNLVDGQDYWKEPMTNSDLGFRSDSAVSFPFGSLMKSSEYIELVFTICKTADDMFNVCPIYHNSSYNNSLLAFCGKLTQDDFGKVMKLTATRVIDSLEDAHYELTYQSDERITFSGPATSVSRMFFAGSGGKVCIPSAVEINCLRMYSNVLSRDQVEHNHELDMFRFKLKERI